MKIDFPSFEKNSIYDEFDYYGCSHIISKYLSAEFINRKKISIVYSHGWVPDYWLGSDPRIIYAHSYLNKTQLIFVARKTIKQYLNSIGYTNVHSIGLPVVYLPEKKHKRIPNSLLVMPSHSLDYTKHNHFRFKEYVEDINKIKHHFNEVFICIHPSCFKNNYWINEFKEAGFHNIITGIDIRDKNALYRLKKIMESFEFVTTNGFGSHIAYAAYFGAKVSVYGIFANYKSEDYENAPFYMANPDILEKSLELCSECLVRNNYPDLFKEPHLATTNIEWGRYEVGFFDRKQKKELLGIFKAQNNLFYKKNKSFTNLLNDLRKKISFYRKEHKI